ncbi:vacuolar protein sorting-associated protein 52-like protein [Dermatophagoides farinae]|uniref:Vacuolar protein sorting-associated protein 52 homolog n=1 Tax=Dermatophagoides farinae TaxID=6954 RepID=A0A9D4P1F9_DERFA|nr:vacuolar protein sorting-associated protein 52-like protein [Dermatophagoides farinae]
MNLETIEPAIDCDEETVKEILNSNIDLREYSANVEKSLSELENNTIAGYIKEADNISELHLQITDSDKILERLEGMLCAFQADLSNICQEILSLQELSASLNIRLKNKQAIRNQMSEFIDDIIIPESVIKHIVDTPVCEKEFLEQLIILDHKIAFVKEQSFREAKACVDVMEILNNLKSKAIIKIPTHERDIAREIQNEYIDTMSKIYFSYFKEFIHKSTKMMYEDLPDKDDLMGNDDSHKANKISIFNLKSNVVKHRPNIFSLGDRESLLTIELESPLIVVHAATKNDMKYPLENVFREIQYAFFDHACREYLFMNEFFMVNSKTSHDLFYTIFGKTLDLLYKNIDSLFSQSYDAIALFVCLHIIYRYRILSLKRNVIVLSHYWERVVKTIWPQFEQVFLMHIESIKFCDLIKIATIDMRPHYITRRFAEFSAAIVTINDTFPDVRVTNLLSILQNEVMNLILRMSTKFCKPKEQYVFIINNYDTILGVLLERKKDGSNEAETMREQLNKKIMDFIEEMLYPHFGAMISFVKESEVLTEKNDTESLKRLEPRVGDLIQNFNNNWRRSLEQVSKDIMASFTNFRNGNNIQQIALTQLVQYYHKFQKIVSQPPFSNNPLRSELINIHQLMVEVKKYKTNF